MPKNSHLQWQVNYEPGTLEAVGYKKGKKITTKVETTSTPYKVVATLKNTNDCRRKRCNSNKHLNC